MPTIPWSPLFLKNRTFLKDDGTPAALYKLYTYVAGTSTPISLSSTSDGTTPVSNPYVLNSEGRPDDTLFQPNSTAIKIIWTDENGPASPTPIPPGGVTLTTDDEIENPGAVAFANLGNILAEGSRDEVSGYVIDDDDNTITVLPAASPDPCLIFLPAAIDRTFPLTIISKATAVTVRITRDGTDTINGASANLDLVAGVSPRFSGVTLNSDGVSDWLLSAYWVSV